MTSVKVAKSSKQGNTSKAAIAAALAHITRTQQPLYALAMFGEHLAENRPVDIFAVHESTKALCDKARDAYAEAADELAHLRHRAIPFLRKAADALDCLEYIVEEADASQEGTRVKPSRLFRVSVGKAILAFVSESGRWMERAEEALGEPANCGWLSSLMNVSGTELPEGEGGDRHMWLDIQEQWVFQKFHILNEDQRRDVAAFVGAMVK